MSFTSSTRRNGRSIVALLAAMIAMVVGPAPALAAPIRDESSGLSVDLTVPGAKTCVIVPIASRSAEGCEGIDVAKLEEAARKEPNSPLILALIRDGAARITVTSTFASVTLASKEDLDAFVEGALEVGLTQKTPGYELVTVHEIQALRLRATAS